MIVSPAVKSVAPTTPFRLYCKGLVVDNKGTVGIATNDLELNTTLVGAASSLVGLYIGDGSLLFSKDLSRSGGYYITTGVNALNAGPVSLNTKMTLDGTWVIV